MIWIRLLPYAIAAFLVAGALYWLYDTGYSRGATSVQAKWDAASAKQREVELAAGAAASTKLETDNAKARTVYRTITRTVDKIVDRPVYVRACFDADGLRIAADALRGPRADPGKPDRPMPGLDAARGGDRGGRPAEDH